MSTALRIASITGLISLLMFGVTTFLFAFSGGQVRMEPVVKYGALAVFVAVLVLAAIVWRLRSAGTALTWAWIVTLAAWAVAVFIEWRVSFVLGA